MDIDVDKIFNNFDPNNDVFSDMLLKDFQLHFGITTLSILLKFLISQVKTAEEKEAIKVIPDQIIATWEKRISESIITDCNGYIDTLMQDERSHYADSEVLKKVAQRLADNEQVCFKGLVKQLKESFSTFKETIV